MGRGDAPFTAGRAADEGDARFFVGRLRELDLFRRWLGASGGGRVLNLHGPGGVGKSWLLGAFHRVARESGARFVPIDSRSFLHSPAGLAARIAVEFSGDGPEGDAVAHCLRLLREASGRAPVVLAFDTYEEMADLDAWIREGFLPALPPGVLVILSGRHPLRGAWRESPAWRRAVVSLPLGDFEPAESREYLSRCGIRDPDAQRRIRDFTQGHPLALSLAASLVERGGLAALEHLPERAEILAELARRWLCEVSDAGGRALVEAAAIGRAFDQETLAHLLGEAVSEEAFQRLTALSFVQRGWRGWALHDLVRMAVAAELRWRQPFRYRLLWRRALGLHLRRAVSSGSEETRASAMNEFFFLLGDAMIRAAFFASPGEEEGLGVVPAGPGNLGAVRAYIEEWTERAARVDGLAVEMIDPDTQAHFHHVVPREISHFEAVFLRPLEWLDLVPEAFRVLTDASGVMRGMTVVLPVNRRTLPRLLAQPVTGPYFRSLAPSRLAWYDVAEAGTRAWFIRLIDVRDPADLAAWAALFRDLLRLAFRAERVLASTSLPFYREMLQRFGFEEVPGATHRDYGQPAPTYLLDLGGTRVEGWLERLASGAGAAVAPDLPIDAFGLTEREREVVRMLLAGLSNAGIALRLGVAEITVKKHLSRIYAKTGTESRTQLMRCVFEAGRRPADGQEYTFV